MSPDMQLELVPVIDFATDPEIVWVVAEGERLTYGHLFNPTFATETSLIEPLPHQRIAVYEHLLKQTRLRFLLADDAGAGKTIMAGLYIREMLSRRLIRRVLIAPPAGLVGNWEREMKTLFSRELTRIKNRQRLLASLREEAIASLRREPELIAPGEVTFLAHALVMPSSDPEDKKRHDKEIEAIAVKFAWGYEEENGANVKDVSTPQLARAVGLMDYPGFDLLSIRPSGDERAIEVKGRAGIGDVELTENEWVKACNLRDRYWLYVVFDCASSHPRLLRIQDPFGKLIVRSKTSVMIDERELFQAAETGN